jgi:hypothetical protein
MGQRCPHGSHSCHQVELEGPRPAVVVFLDEPTGQCAHAGVVDEHIKPSVNAHGVIHQPSGAVGGRQVDPHMLDLQGRSLRLVTSPTHHQRPFGGQRLADCQTDPCAGAGDDGDRPGA